MKPPRFILHTPTALQEAIELLAAYGEASKVLAGGQSLLPMLSFRLAMPEHVVDINRLPGLDMIERTRTGWRLPALVRQRTVELSDELAAAVPLLPSALKHVAHPQVRNRGTVCGSLAHADAAAELPCVMVALDARMSIASASGIRRVVADDFFAFHLTTAVEPDEMLLAVEFDDPAPRTYTSFQEFALRQGDFCLAGTAVSVVFDEAGTVVGSRVVVAGVASTPLRLTGVENLIAGSSLDSQVLAEARRTTAGAVDPTGDIHADATYRRQLASVLVGRALLDVKAKESAPHDQS